MSTSSYIREIERRIERAEKQAHAQPDVPNAPVGVPEAYVEHVALMFDLLALAFQADLTRVFTFMMAREVSQRTYPEIGVTEPHHSISHHAQSPGCHRGARETERLPREHVREVHRTTEVDARWRRIAPRSLDPRVRQRHE